VDNFFYLWITFLKLWKKREILQKYYEENKKEKQSQCITYYENSIRICFTSLTNIQRILRNYKNWLDNIIKIGV
jgi:hypothetical protein